LRCERESVGVVLPVVPRSFKTDKIDAKVLARLGAADSLPEVWTADEQTRALRRRLAHGASLVAERTRLRNQVHAVLARDLVELPACDLFGRRGRRLWSSSSCPSSAALDGGDAIHRSARPDDARTASRQHRHRRKSAGGAYAPAGHTDTEGCSFVPGEESALPSTARPTV
jgi:transposase